MDLNQVKPFLCDDTTSTDLRPLWEKWKRSFDYFAIGKGVTDSRRKRALLLHCAGPQVQDIFDTLPDKGDDRNFEAAVTALDKHFNPLVNKFYERHKFRQMAQQDKDSIDQFIARLRQQAARCQYADTEQNLLDQLIEKYKNTKVRTKVLEAGNDLTLVQALSIARTVESVTLQEQVMASPSANRTVRLIKSPPLERPVPEINLQHPNSHFHAIGAEPTDILPTNPIAQPGLPPVNAVDSGDIMPSNVKPNCNPERSTRNRGKNMSTLPRKTKPRKAIRNMYLQLTNTTQQQLSG